MTKKNILLVGDGNHQFITNYSKWVKKSSSKKKYEIDVLSLSKISTNNKKYYNNIFQIESCFLTKIKFVGKYFRLLFFKKQLSKLPNYNYVHFHFFGEESQYISNYFSKKTNCKIIISIWGSDMYRNKSVNFILACRNAYLITFTSQQSIEFFKSKYEWSKDNIRLCSFGLAPIDNLKKLSKTKQECKIDLKLNAKKIMITIGYNMAPEQQHLKILEQFNDEKILRLKDDIQLVLPISYGGSVKYKLKILSKLTELPFEYKIFDTFLSNIDVAKIRKASDIMLQFQITDQLSGSMLEHIFAKNIVITGSWLPYENLKEKKYWFYDIKMIEDIKSLIPQIISNYESISQKTYNNQKLLGIDYSWNNTIKKWLTLYKS